MPNRSQLAHFPIVSRMGSDPGKRAASGCVNAEAGPALLQPFLSRVSG